MIKNNLALILILVAVIILAYYDSFNNSFIWDDHSFIVENQSIRKLDVKNIISYFSDWRATASNTDLAHDVWRPLVTLSFAIDYKYWKLDSRFYHVENVIFHIVNALLVYTMTVLILGDVWIAFLASLVFSIHPVQTGAVTWISGRSNVLFLLFFLLSFIFHARNRIVPSLIFFTLSLGLGLPLFLLAMFSGQLERLPRSGGWMIWVRSLMGWVLVAMAVHFIRPVVPGHWGTVLIALVVLAAGLHLGWIDKNQAGFRAFPWLKGGVGVACLVLATFLVMSWAMRGPGVTWKPYSEETLKEAQSLKKPVIIDFYATWCTPCRELEDVTFHDASVVKQAESDFVMVKVDVTRGGNPMHERLLREYGVKGVPTIVFLNPVGKERLDLRLVDYLPPDQFLGRMAGVKKNGG